MVGLVLFAASLMLYLMFIQPAYQNVQGVKARFLSEEAFLRGEADVIEQVKKLISSYQGEDQIRAAVSEALPVKEDVAGTITQVSGLAEQSALNIISIGVSGVAPQTKKTSSGGVSGAPAPKASFRNSIQKPIGSVSFEMKLSGGYENLKNFISYLETNLLIFDVESISVKSLPASSNAKVATDDLFEFEVLATTYYQSQ